MKTSKRTVKATKTTLPRNEYGALSLHQTDHRGRMLPVAGVSPADAAALSQARAMVAQAVQGKKLPYAYDAIETSWHKRHGRQFSGYAVHHDIFDFTPTCVVVCVRSTEGTKYGVKTTDKSYYLLQRKGKGVAVTDAPKAKVAKAAKDSRGELGNVIAVCKGQAKLAVAACQLPRTTYKVVAVSGDSYESVFDGSAWDLNRERSEAVQDGHGGGFYHYATAEEAIDATRKGVTFASAWVEGKTLALLECQSRGRTIEYASGKLASTYLRPLREISRLTVHPDLEREAA